MAFSYSLLSAIQDSCHSHYDNISDFAKRISSLEYDFNPVKFIETVSANPDFHPYFGFGKLFPLNNHSINFSDIDNTSISMCFSDHGLDKWLLDIMSRRCKSYIYILNKGLKAISDCQWIENKNGLINIIENIDKIHETFQRKYPFRKKNGKVYKFSDDKIEDVIVTFIDQELFSALYILQVVRKSLSIINLDIDEKASTESILIETIEDKISTYINNDGFGFKDLDDASTLWWGFNRVN